MLTGVEMTSAQGQESADRGQERLREALPGASRSGRLPFGSPGRGFQARTLDGSDDIARLYSLTCRAHDHLPPQDVESEVLLAAHEGADSPFDGRHLLRAVHPMDLEFEALALRVHEATSSASLPGSGALPKRR